MRYPEATFIDHRHRRALTAEQQELADNNQRIDADDQHRRATEAAIKELREQARRDGPPTAFEPCETFPYLPTDLRASLKRGSKAAQMAREVCTALGLPV